MVEKIEVSGKKLGWDENVKKKKKKLVFPRETLRFLAKLLLSLAKLFAFPCKTFAFSRKTS